MTDEKDIAVEIAKELAKDLYEDAGHEVVKPTGKLVGLLPRAIHAALQPLEMWTMQREYNIAATKKLLEMKLEKIDPAKLSPPEAYVAVPALQAISYCMDNEELRNMYANLLAKSMTDAERDGVHPGFVEIIKQMCPDEAKIMKYFVHRDSIPTIGVRCENAKHVGINIVRMFSDVGETMNCDYPLKIEQYLNNLIRLGLLAGSEHGVSYADKSNYHSCKQHPYILEMQRDYANRLIDYPNVQITEGYVYVTELGTAFCNTCIKEL